MRDDVEVILEKVMERPDDASDGEWLLRVYERLICIIVGGDTPMIDDPNFCYGFVRAEILGRLEREEEYRNRPLCGDAK